MDYNKQELKPITEWDGNPRWMFVWDKDSKEVVIWFVCKREHGFWLARRYPDPREKLHLYDFAAEIPQTQTQAVDKIYDDFRQWKKEYYENRPVEPYSVDSEGAAELLDRVEQHMDECTGIAIKILRLLIEDLKNRQQNLF